MSKIVKYLSKVRYEIYVWYLASRWIFQINLGDSVWYNGKRYIVASGVIANMWRLCGLDNSHDGWVSRSACKKERSLVNYYYSFRSGYRFYKSSWYTIWCDDGIKLWMTYLEIWPRRGK
jgi:hypothetical protein